MIGFWTSFDLSSGVGESTRAAGKYGSQSSISIANQVGSVLEVMLKEFILLKAHAQ